MSDYTPTTLAICKVYSAAPIVTEENRLGDRDIAKNVSAFNRWLTARDHALSKRIIDAIEALPGPDGEAVSDRYRGGYLLAVSEAVEEIQAMLANPDYRS